MKTRSKTTKELGKAVRAVQAGKEKFLLEAVLVGPKGRMMPGKRLLNVCVCVRMCVRVCVCVWGGGDSMVFLLWHGAEVKVKEVRRVRN